MTDNNAPQNYRLIDGVFSSQEAKKILMALIQDKISFHQRNNWSRKERLGELCDTSSGRIDELLQTKADLLALINDAHASNKQLAINCTIEIKRQA